MQEISDWVGRRETRTDVVSATVADMLEATLNPDTAAPAEPGAGLPRLAHGCAYTPKGGMGQLAPDGHAKLGGFLPPVPLDRRMWAGGSLEFHAPLHVGAQITRDSTILKVDEKQGATGRMIFVSLRHELSQGTTRCITEQQDVVYLDIPDTYSPPRKQPIPEGSTLTLPAPVTEATLFRFSAATFNAHRIHYDLPYARDVEKYPGLVVHGPLQAMFLMRAAITFAGRLPRMFTFRGVHPIFHFDDLHLYGTETPDGMTLCTGVPDSHQGLQAKLIWEDAR